MDQKVLDLLDATIKAVKEANINYMIGGGLALIHYGMLRETHDLDIFVKQEDAEKLIKGFEKQGMLTKLTDKRWLYQATLGKGLLEFKKNNTIDVIFQNDTEIKIGDRFLLRAQKVKFHDRQFNVISVEDLVLFKAHSQKEWIKNHWRDGVWLINNHILEFNWDYFLSLPEAYSRKVLGFLLMVDSVRQEVPFRVIKQISDKVL
ncbi:TPA: hypothetical protein DDW69_01150 [candidate division CPR2 bacterium]|uniref:Uncharacterized protein n=1 Tax=candidate division CPR2 bacterium GW2011_GWC1_41_48 TaxID=1618344 RepID=A0A0G0YJE1_UNCC2|nr:MAG: hypothetical protein UT47_C0001G0036 [candidate division CPR2 bacterium GW2011_GWC2_39_35]KKR29476.1 MAG: hypothetical protein UT60_C0001G0012 [candidate division CPR2 bacterium GW2011_GWD2_39_7]KKR29701.1 MAG: hypothetical protein UT59_C0001G0010 [candidate division CPR2 bacterium GW2011_GWD1_39_7]KKS09631.1 MAG: hypothetical protein UU65_C0001G0036 [candidate division CPR2 bacterium GW2011_GWC1_41_48]OGB59486.1 MAG: hypothetical protein A2Y27_00840 [candidate division CPR2 bacterium G